MSYPLWRRISVIGRNTIFAGATVGSVYVISHYVVHGYLPELPQWTRQYVDRPPLNKFWERPNDKLGNLKQAQLQEPTTKSNVVPKKDVQSQTMPAQKEAKIANAVDGIRPEQLNETATTTTKEEDELKRHEFAKQVESALTQLAATKPSLQRGAALDGQSKTETAQEGEKNADERTRPKQSNDKAATEDDEVTKVEQEHMDWEAEMVRQLKRAAIAHAEHLERVIRTQKQIHDVENKQLVEEAIAIERQKCGKQIENALTKLAAIEASLQSRTALDLENRRAKIYWTICQSLMEALVNGGAAQNDGTQIMAYETSMREVELLKQLAESDTFAQSVCSHFPSETIGQRGVPTERGLVKRFDKVYTLARRTAQIGDEGGTLLRYIASWLQSLVTFELPNAYSAEDRVDLNRYDPYDLLARCRHFVQQGDLLNAVRVANLIRGESSRIFTDWINDAKLHLEVRLLVELLFAHSEVSGIRTIY